MQRFERVHEKHKPQQEMAERWPEWSVFDTPDLAPMAERFSFNLRTILMNSDGDREWMTAHVLAHLDLDHHLEGGDITAAEESDADLLARIRLDLLAFDEMGDAQEPEPEGAEWDDVPMDGEPTVYLRGGRGPRP
jgi:hypothetical protein